MSITCLNLNINFAKNVDEHEYVDSNLGILVMLGDCINTTKKYIDEG